jgi:hypothetical protein
MLLPHPELVSFGLEAHGHGTIVGCGNPVIGIVRHIRALSGFRTAMLFAMDTMYSFAAVGDEMNAGHVNCAKGHCSQCPLAFQNVACSGNETGKIQKRI